MERSAFSADEIAVRLPQHRPRPLVVRPRQGDGCERLVVEGVLEVSRAGEPLEQALNGLPRSLWVGRGWAGLVDPFLWDWCHDD